MSKAMQITLRPGEKIFINGAVLRVDRKVTLELMNDATFLLESHVLQVEDTTTPLRQLYFVIQAILMDPRNAEAARHLFHTQWAALRQAFKNETVLEGLETIATQVIGGRTFDALRTLRGLFVIEDAILAHGGSKAA
ncbi:putative flagellum biosynthesis repressor protein [Azorhizobium caulinodans ORS 571]|uniref:Putative flagellum biosynthesis repressor protein n=1 Tax=Azorhizobium caulinodans (strain ATCC 43989 / DSM 5975 / JCM 20966 / LMG 6465 / NBRC 14845 / NCIMB 13405 / ORS 571) TaxID=438753 RepID=A8IPM3_AZOC5|nr:flagellar biosynthesis repressor FlbT [Azorhizobium caulinodans]BAF86649.1 putative flagellum biosynthesis repressor protein [Azorhizobium caulinodans ORS 571]